MHSDVSLPGLPLLVVFGLDYTLWPCFVDAHVLFPLLIYNTSYVLDCHGVQVEYYKDVPYILRKLKQMGTKVGVTSLSDNKAGSRELLDAFGWSEYISFMEFSLPTKKEQFAYLHTISGVKFAQMLFFDDLEENIEEVAELGVLGVYVPNGMTSALLQEGIQLFLRSKQRINDAAAAFI